MITLLSIILAAGDLVTYRGACLVVHSVGPGPISVAYVYATDQTDMRRTFRVLASEVTPGCAP